MGLLSALLRTGASECLTMTTASQAYRLVKRAFDVSFSAAVVVLGAAPGLALALLVALDTKGAPIYSETRVGHRGPFPCLKYRTMVVDSDNLEKYFTPEQIELWHREHKVPDDPRVTRIGAILRAIGIDEFPQFVNVLRGEMSIVGPRAITADELERYFDPEQRALYLSVPSGITGAWQVGPRNEATFENGRRMRIELDYVRNASLKRDFDILCATFGVMFVKRNGA